MSAAKHTHGPWLVVPGHRGFIVTTKSGAYDIAVVRDIGNESNEANARLIASAPDLLEALQNMHQVLQEAMSTGGWVPTPVQASFRAAWIDMTAAIAKATGGAA